MALGTAPPRNDHLGNGLVATYAYGFRIFEAGDLLVTKRDTLGIETLLIYPTDFSVTGVDNPAGGTIILVAGVLPSGYALTIRFSEVPRQPTDLRNQGGYFPEVIEDGLDRLTRYAQQQQDSIDRSYKLPETEVGTPAATRMPSALDRASRFFGWDGAGNPIATSGAPDLIVPVTPFMVTLLDDTTAAIARATLGAAPLADPVLTGNPQAPTPTAGDADTSIATTGFVRTELQRSQVNFAVGAGSANAITATIPSDLVALVNGMRVLVESTAANTTAVTFNLTLGATATGALAVYKGANAALIANDIPGANYHMLLEYDASLTKWQLINPMPTIVGTVTQGTPALMNPVVFNATVVTAHGLGVLPLLYYVELINITTELGWTAGQHVVLPPSHSDSNTTGGYTVTPDGSNITISTGPNLAIVPKAGGAATGITAAKWQLQVVPIRIN